MTRTVNIFVTMLLLSFCALSAFSQNYAKKLKNAKGIEVVYESSFKGRVSPEKTLMTICGNEVEVKSLISETAERKQHFPEIKTYEDYSTHTLSLIHI